MNPETLMRPGVRSLQPYRSARDEYQGTSGSMVFLDANENPFETGLNRYPDPHHRALRRALSELKDVPMDSLILGNGSDEVLDLLFRVFCVPGLDKVVIQPPTYGMYKVLADINDVSVISVPLTADFQPDANSVLAAITDQTKIVFFCSPNNPTGNLLDEQLIEAVLSAAKCMVVVDEAYVDFSTRPSWTTRLSDHPNLVVTQTLSKAYGLAGIRLGMVMAHSSVIEAMNRIKPPYNVNQLTQDAALDRIQGIEVAEQIERILHERERLFDALQEVDFVQYVYPSDANFLLVKVDDGNKRYQQMIAEGIVLRNRSTQPGCDNTLRITVGTSKENDDLLTTLQRIT